MSDFASERFMAGVGGAAAAVPDEPRQMYGDESMCASFPPVPYDTSAYQWLASNNSDDIVPGPTVAQMEEEERRAAAAKLVKERARIEVSPLLIALA